MINTQTHGFAIHPIPAFQDNYIWIIHDNESAVIVDPGQSQGVIDFLNQHQLRLDAILLTHAHHDHIGGVAKLCDTYPSAEVYAAEDPAITLAHHRVRESDCYTFLQQKLTLSVMEIPGHTGSHIAFTNNDLLFCGDTLFSAGCGRVLGGTLTQLHYSLHRLAQLDDNVAVFAAHEYTLANLRFSHAVEPDNLERDRWEQHCQAQRNKELPTLPSRIGIEKQINPFLRCHLPHIQQALCCSSTATDCSLQTFIKLREWKDSF